MNEEQEIKMKAFLAVITAAKADAKVKGLKRDAGGVSSMPCPAIGCASTLRYSVASVNGHMHAACDNKNCVRCME
jgi:hypothetical protein